MLGSGVPPVEGYRLQLFWQYLLVQRRVVLWLLRPWRWPLWQEYSQELQRIVSPFFSRAFSASLRDLEDKLTTQLALSTYGVSTADTIACFSGVSFSNFCLCLSLVVLKTRWMLVLICSSSLLAPSIKRADVMLCAVDSVSFFASPLAFCVSLIRSLRNLMDASSATLRVPLMRTGTL